MITEAAEGGFRVSCEVLECSRPLMRVALDERHAGNLARKHARDYHLDAPEFAEDDVAELARVMANHHYETRDGEVGHLEECARVVLAAGYVAPPF